MNRPVDILLVEDSDEDAELTLRTLTKQKLTKLHRVSDGVEALEFLKSATQVPRVIMLDLKLPKLNGLEVLKQIRANEHTKSIPVVVLTSSKEDRDLHAAYELGVNSYIVKPVEFDKFVKAIETLGLYWVLLNEPKA
jgi:two-component system response regulator